MSDRFYPISIDKLFRWILAEEEENRIFGIYKELFFTPNNKDKFKIMRYGKTLDTPIGVAAGPHTQLSQNIIASWLTGARYIELKTIQTLDQIEVTKPCIDMEDEGYNCEWSQELKISESFDEYLNAWIIIHLLKHKFGWDMQEPGFIFNMSVGYDLEGILKPNVQWFFEKMNNCREEKEKKIETLAGLYPAIAEIEIPDQISDNITLSTMHGCPPEEIEKIGKYLIDEKKLHTTIKLNPTLLGPEKLRNILNDKLGYEIKVPDEAFQHDLKYNDAVSIIKSLQYSADNAGVEFGLKLTNTLESLNTTRWLPASENMVYTSGRALHPISINLAEKLQLDFNGELDISFSAGVDAFNLVDTLSCNIKPITVCSDILKPGGYLRMTQYLENIEKEIVAYNCTDINEFIIAKSGAERNPIEAGLLNLKNYAALVLENKVYQKNNFPYDNIKTSRPLTEYDCIHAPCIEACAVSQDVPEYMYHTANGNFDAAYKTILKDNPLPNITGNVCDHLCQAKCTRLNYDNPLLIRGIKRFVAENHNSTFKFEQNSSNGLKAAVIGAGPSGLSCAYFLALKGFKVDLYESKDFAGGMVSDSIPHFRLTDKQINDDIEIIKSLGVNFHFNFKVTKEFFVELQTESDFIYIAIGAQKGKLLNITGEELESVYDQLSFLAKIRRGEKINIGPRVAIIGGGNSAIDAARTANRLTESEGKVTVIYRRTKKEMPADSEEISALLEEGIELLELAAPLSIKVGKSSALLLKCIRMKLGDADESGRRRPIQIEDSEFELHFDSIISAIGQDVELDFIPNRKLTIDNNSNETQFKNIFAGGDAVRGADSLINAIGDGKQVAETIIKRAVKENRIEEHEQIVKHTTAEFQRKQAFRSFGTVMPEINLIERNSFELVHPSLEVEAAMHEADRCLYCNDICNICIGVCPNFSNVSFKAEPAIIPIYRVIKEGNSVTFKIIDQLIIEQENQIFNIGDFCNECGNCNTFCPTSGAPYKTKPQFYLTEESFNSENNCYYLKDTTLKYKSNGSTEVLEISDDFYIYESNEVRAKFNLDNFAITDVVFKNDKLETLEIRRAAEMIFLLKNLHNNSLLKTK